MILAALTAAAMMMQAAPASAASPTGIAGTRSVSPLVVTPRPADKVAVANKKLVCSEETVLGTLFHKRMCFTQQELTEQRRVDQAATRQAQAARPYKIDTGAQPGT
ncbi:MAG: hypothetical protein JSR98_17275 [Proteobacteria bacterium]|nr:hypothetical protein [Pseudomonadota bacterium]